MRGKELLQTSLIKTIIFNFRYFGLCHRLVQGLCHRHLRQQDHAAGAVPQGGPAAGDAVGLAHGLRSGLCGSGRGSAGGGCGVRVHHPDGGGQLH